MRTVRQCALGPKTKAVIDDAERLRRATKHRDRDTLREEVAKRYHLKVVSGCIPLPDLRIEYANENDWEIQRRDLELATEHYRPRGLSEKARAGFELYTRRVRPTACGASVMTKS